MKPVFSYLIYWARVNVTWTEYIIIYLSTLFIRSKVFRWLESLSVFVPVINVSDVISPSPRVSPLSLSCLTQHPPGAQLVIGQPWVWARLPTFTLECLWIMANAPHNLYISFLLFSLKLHWEAIKFECTNNFAINYLLRICLLCNCCVPINTKHYLTRKDKMCLLYLVDWLSFSVFFFLQSWWEMKNVARYIPNVQAKVFYCVSHQKHLLFSSFDVKGRKTLFYVKHKLFILKGSIEMERLVHYLRISGDVFSFLLLMRAPRF